MKTLYIERFFLKWDLCPWSKGWTYWTFVCIYEENYDVVSEFYTQSKPYEIT